MIRYIVIVQTRDDPPHQFHAMSAVGGGLLLFKHEGNAHATAQCWAAQRVGNWFEVQRFVMPDAKPAERGAA